MAQIRNTFGEARSVPSLGRTVLDGQVVTVDDDDVYAFTQQDGWVPADADTQAVHDEAAAAAQALEQQLSAPVLTPPPSNASRAAWADFVLACGWPPESLGSSEDGTELGRDAIRDTYYAQIEG